VLTKDILAKGIDAGGRRAGGLREKSTRIGRQPSTELIDASGTGFLRCPPA